MEQCWVKKASDKAVGYIFLFQKLSNKSAEFVRSLISVSLMPYIPFHLQLSVYKIAGTTYLCQLPVKNVLTLDSIRIFHQQDLNRHRWSFP